MQPLHLLISVLALTTLPLLSDSFQASSTKTLDNVREKVITMMMFLAAVVLFIGACYDMP